MSPIPFLRAHWRPLAGALALALAFAAGRFAAPEHVRTEFVDDSTHVTTNAEAVTRVVYRDRVTVRDRTVVTHPDGTTEHRDVERTEEHDGQTDKTEHATADATEHVRTETKTIDRPAPAWFVGANLGVPLNLDPVGVGAPFVVVHVDRRILGPVSAGAWASLDLKGHNPAVGLSIGVTF